MSDFTDKLEKDVETFEAMISGPLSVGEIVAFVAALSQTVVEYDPNITEDELKAKLLEAWGWANGKWEIAVKVDDLIKLPEPLESLDDVFITWVMEQFALPMLAKVLAKK